jgi:hypothetical protein
VYHPKINIQRVTLKLLLLICEIQKKSIDIFLQVRGSCVSKNYQRNMIKDSFDENSNIERKLNGISEKIINECCGMNSASVGLIIACKKQAKQ